MITSYVVYNDTTGEIKNTITCDASNIASQEIPENHSYVEGTADRNTQKIDVLTGLPVYKTEAESKESNYLKVVNRVSDLSDVNSIVDTELNVRISDFYYGHVTPEQWRVENYTLLRKAAYPEISERVDAEVKVNSGIEALVTEGEAQLAKYIEDCLNVKTRFPKE